VLAGVVDALQHDKIFCEQGLEGRAMAVVEIDGGHQFIPVLLQEPG